MKKTGKHIIITPYETKHYCKLEINHYVATNQIALELLYYDEDYKWYMPYATLSVCIRKMPEDDMIALDTNNCRWVEEMFKKYKLGTLL